jgi:hypothetical protein
MMAFTPPHLFVHRNELKMINRSFYFRNKWRPFFSEETFIGTKPFCWHRNAHSGFWSF